MELLQEARDLSERLSGLRRELHRIPELDLELPETAAVIKRELDRLGIAWTEGKRCTSVTAVIGRGAGAVVGLRADMDALPVREETGLPYASRNGNMHACGHDGHMAILLGAAAILKRHEAELPGRVKLIFQPGEENLIGAKLMLEEGALEHPHVDRLLALHVGHLAGDYEKDSVVIGDGSIFLASECVEMEIFGKGGHAASPHLTVDPVVIGAELVQALQGLISREIAPGTHALISITSFLAGNGAYNVIPDSVRLCGGIRAARPEVQDTLLRRAAEVTEQLARAHRARGVFRRVSGCPPLLNDPAVTASVRRSAAKLFSDIQTQRGTVSGAEDASYFFREVPGCYFFLNNAAAGEDGVLYPHHNGKFRMDDTSLWKGTALLVQAAVDLME